MAAIARAAEVGERTGYRYFTDKEEMLLAEDEQMRAALSSAIVAQPLDAAAAAVRHGAHAVADLLERQRPQLEHRAAIIEAPALRARSIGSSLVRWLTPDAEAGTPLRAEIDAAFDELRALTT